MNVTFSTTPNSFTVEPFGTGLGQIMTEQCNSTGLFPITLEDNTVTDITQFGCLGFKIPPAVVNGVATIFYDILKLNGTAVMTGGSVNGNNLDTPANRSLVLNDVDPYYPFTLETTTTISSTSASATPSASASASASATTSASATPSASASATPTGVNVTCPRDTTTGHATWPATNPGTTATGICNTGYSGSPTRDCLAGGSWSTSLGGTACTGK